MKENVFVVIDFWELSLKELESALVTAEFINTLTAGDTHLLRVNAQQQLAFLERLHPHLLLEDWSVYETGWPYSEGKLLKRTIANLASHVGGKEILGAVLGNRFRAILRKPVTESGGA